MLPPYSENADPAPLPRHQASDATRRAKPKRSIFNYVPLDPNAFHGKRTAIVRFETVDGKPAAGRDVVVRYYVDHYGLLPVFSGPVPESGEITLNDITDANPADGQRRESVFRPYRQ